MSALRLFGVARAEDAPARRASDDRPDRRSRREAEAAEHASGRIVFRNLVALVQPSASPRPALADDDVRAHHAAVAEAFATHGVLPAPAGTVFRSESAVRRWLELHYVTLVDALEFVEGRAAARVHVAPRPGAVDASAARAAGVDAKAAEASEGAAGDTFRALRRFAAASVTLSTDGSAASASFLVERARWAAFMDAVSEEDSRAGTLAVSATGPWPPYDFVRMQFGG